jgi:anti-sigma factor RsiW
MNEHLREDRIQDYVDDLLCHEERAEVEQHLLVCATCQADVAALRDLVTGLRVMEPAVLPERDILAGINAGINAGIDAGIGAGADSADIDARFANASRGSGTGRLPMRERTLWSMRAPLAAAALALIAISAAITMQVARTRAGADTAQSQRAPVSPRSAARLAGNAYDNTVDRRFLSATEDLEHQLAAQRAHLAPETVRLVEENLRIIDDALAEARAALRYDPNNAALTDLMRSAYEKKIDLLRNATQTRGSS